MYGPNAGGQHDTDQQTNRWCQAHRQTHQASTAHAKDHAAYKSQPGWNEVQERQLNGQKEEEVQGQQREHEGHPHRKARWVRWQEQHQAQERPHQRREE